MTQTAKPSSHAEQKLIAAMTLSQLCSEAADHMARARRTLADTSGDAESALLHLDEAIFCLKRMLAHGRAATSGRPASL
jgi:predicted ATPase with chaperone activity